MPGWFEETFPGGIRYSLRIRNYLYSGRSEFQKIDVVETEQFGRALALDNIWQTSEGDEHLYHEPLVHPALCTLERIERVLVIGGGDGGTVREVLRHPEVKECVMVEIDAQVVEVSKKYLPGIGSAWDDPRLKLIIGDGIAYAKDDASGLFDAVVLDGSDPVGPAEGLFNADFFRAVARRLKPEGAFSLQSESPLIQRETFLEVQRTLGGIFAHVHPMFSNVPIYGGGMWSWTYATNAGRSRHLDLIDERVERIERTSRFYNRECHDALFAMPQEYKRLLGR